MAFLLVYGLSHAADPSWLRDFYPIRRFREAAAALGIEIRVEVDGPGDPSWRGEGAVLLRGVADEGRRRAWAAAAGRIVQREGAWSLARDKAAYPEFFARLGIPHPPTYPPGFPLDELAGRLPLVLKPRRGMMGRGLSIIRDRSGWEEWKSRQGMAATASLLPEDWIAQDFISESEGRDIRVFVAEGAILGSIERRSAGGASNAARGGRAFPARPDCDTLDTALSVISAAGLAYGTADFLMSDRGPLLCEINADPGFHALEEALGVDAAGAIIRSVPGWRD